MYNAEHAFIDDRVFYESRKKLQAYWLSAGTIAWPLAGPTFETEFVLYVGNVRWQDGRIAADQSFPLRASGSVNDAPELTKTYPYLSGLGRFESDELQKNAADLVSKDLVFCVQRQDGRPLMACGVQLFGLLDELCFYAGNDLGVTFDASGTPRLRLWAPTARSVRLHLFGQSRTEPADSILPLERSEKGTWTLTGRPDWKNRFYLYELEVFVPRLGEYQTYLTTDPYSRSLSLNSLRSQIVDLSDPALKPAGWDEFTKPKLERFEDISIYELHVRDFSASDLSVPEERRGKYLAFTETETHGARHLKQLADAGLTHVHLLPVCDFATVNDDPRERRDAMIPEDLGPDSAEQQAILAEVRNQDSYNWGYDPIHYFAPEGSYATDADGGKRVLEFRQAVMGLYGLGLRVIMDVVFNHTFRKSDDDLPPFEKLVPGYYYRLDQNGGLACAACGMSGDVATEHRMVEKLMIDSLKMWSQDYKIDGFRFDLMAFHTKDNLRRIREALDPGIYLYGEGWRFGTLDAILPTESCCQANLHGLGVGSFNDRLRDCVRGGNFQTETRADQGFATGLFYDDSGCPERVKTPPEAEHQRLMLLHFMDVIRLSLAGNLKSYSLTTHPGKTVTGGELDFNGTPAGYAASPCESINYVSAHDNYELWDQISAKAPFYKPGRHPQTATKDERVRMQKMALALVAFAQGIPFFHAGSDFLRSKSGDHNSYNSGDWFNRLDFSLTNNNWAAGLPPAPDNRREWDFWAPRLRNPYFKPLAADMRETAEYFRGLLRVRKSSPLFRLADPEQVQARVRFIDTDLGPQQTPGLIVMALRDDLENLEPLDPQRKMLLVAFNATLKPLEFEHESLKGRRLMRHRDWHDTFESRVVVAKFDMNLGKITVPPQTVMVWEESRTNSKKGRPV